MGLQPLPATPGTVAGYLSELKCPPDDRRPLSMATMTRRLAALGQVHLVSGHPNPCVDQLVKDFMRGARREKRVAPRQKKAIATEDIRAAVTALDSRAAATKPHGTAGGAQLIDVRDRLILLLGFAGAMRRSELAAIDLADVEPVAQGLSSICASPRPTRTAKAGGSRSSMATTKPPAQCGRTGRGWPASLSAKS
ncbi:MAG: hypothetical protein QOJ52_963 [Acidimicrobiaceae bacterium]|nr:hypothetical protein [Acidimicrobiaceae bacterium]